MHRLATFDTYSGDVSSVNSRVFGMFPDGKSVRDYTQEQGRDTVNIRRLDSPAQLHALYAFRYQVYVEELEWLDGQNGLLKDQFDAKALNYAAFLADGTLVGSVRVVPDSHLGLPLEHAHPLDDFRPGKRLVEISRLAVSQPYRTSRLPLRLMTAAYQCAQGLQATHVVVDAYLYDQQTALYEKLGFRRLGLPYLDTSYHCPCQVVALTTPLSAVIEEWPRTRPHFHQLFTTPDPEIYHG